MQKVALPLILLFGVLTASAQTTVSIQPGYCVQIYNCILPLSDGDRVWLSDVPQYQPGSIYVLDPAGNFVVDCQSKINAYHFQWGGQPPSQYNRAAQVPFTLHAECDLGAVAIDEVGYGYWDVSSRYGGIRYHVNSGTVSY